ncbi:MAG TPA: YdcF family protein [Bryobacteraceae bacterium]|nr:YdcF family protein [Bryobacteraceae bacterium]
MNSIPAFSLWRIVALVILVTILLTPLALLGVGHWLVTDDPLQPAEAVVVFGGHLPFRAMEAAAIFHKGLVPEVWLTQSALHQEDVELARLGIRTVPEHEYSRQVLQRLGVPSSAIRLLDGRVDNTAEEVNLIAQAARRAGAKKIILITSKYHTRRVGVIWRKLVGGDPQPIVRYPAGDPFDLRSWWRNTRDALAVVRELFGVLNAWAGFPIPSSK